MVSVASTLSLKGKKVIVWPQARRHICRLLVAIQIANPDSTASSLIAHLLWECDVLHSKQTVVVMVCLDGMEPCWYGARGAIPSQDSVMATRDHGGEDVRSRKQGRQEAEQRESSFGGCCPAWLDGAVMKSLSGWGKRVWLSS